MAFTAQYFALKCPKCYHEPRTSQIPGREKSKPWENLRRPTFVFLITRDLLNIFSYFFFLLKVQLSGLGGKKTFFQKYHI